MPSLPTPAQSAASRTNGTLSHGPATEAGKAAPAANAVRHGLAGRRITLDHHESQKLEALRRDYSLRRQPVGALEEAAVASMALALVKLGRADAMEALACDAIARRDADAWPTVATILRYRTRITREHRDAQAELDRLQEERHRSEHTAAARRGPTPPPRTNEPEVRAAPASRPVAKAPAAALNRHERRKLEAIERRMTRAA